MFCRTNQDPNFPQVFSRTNKNPDFSQETYGPGLLVVVSDSHIYPDLHCDIILILYENVSLTAISFNAIAVLGCCGGGGGGGFVWFFSSSFFFFFFFLFFFFFVCLFFNFTLPVIVCCCFFNPQ